jgi:DNA modification methylase
MSENAANSASPAPGLGVQWWPIERVIPFARNPRIAPEIAIAKVAASIKEFGWRQPIVVDLGGVIVAGHTRLLAAKRLGMTVVPVHIASDLTAAQIKAYRLADNRSAQETSWDEELLPLEIGDLVELGYEVDVLGFDEDELARLLAKDIPGLTDPDEVPEPPAEPLTQSGDLWLLGEHRLLCGDSTDREHVHRLMAGERAVLMATDPPYLVDYDGGNHPQTWDRDGRPISPEEKTRRWDAYLDHEQGTAFYRDFLAVALSEALAERPAVYQWFAAMRAPLVFEAWQSVGLKAHQVVVWHKSRAVLGRAWFMWDFEPCMVGWVEGHQPAAKPPANSRAVWDVDQKEGVEEGLGAVHPTIKPVELMRRPIEWHTRPGELIYEPFLGSGTALIAAEMTGRRCYAIELSPTFVDVAVARWCAFTGKEARRG